MRRARSDAGGCAPTGRSTDASSAISASARSSSSRASRSVADSLVSDRRSPGSVRGPRVVASPPKAPEVPPGRARRLRARIGLHRRTRARRGRRRRSRRSARAERRRVAGSRLADPVVVLRRRLQLTGVVARASGGNICPRRMASTVSATLRWTMTLSRRRSRPGRRMSAAPCARGPFFCSCAGVLLVAEGDRLDAGELEERGVEHQVVQREARGADQLDAALGDRSRRGSPSSVPISSMTMTSGMWFSTASIITACCSVGVRTCIRRVRRCRRDAGCRRRRRSRSTCRRPRPACRGRRPGRGDLAKHRRLTDARPAIRDRDRPDSVMSRMMSIVPNTCATDAARSCARRPRWVRLRMALIRWRSARCAARLSSPKTPM